MSARGSHPLLWLGGALAVIVLFAVAPFISLFVAGGVAKTLGCKLTLSTISPCPFMGSDLGTTLTVMGFIGYLAFWTLPIGQIAFTIWLIIACVVVVARWQRRRREA